MKPTTIAITAAVLLVASVAFVLGRRPPAPPPAPSPETGGPMPTGPALPSAAASEWEPTGSPSPAAARLRRSRAAGSSAGRLAPRRAEPRRVVSQSHTDRELRVAVEKPEGAQWVMTSNRRCFRDPVRHPAKVLEIRRDPTDGDGVFAIIELYVVDLPPGAHEASEMSKLERMGRRGRFGKFRVVDERTVSVGGRSMVRRVTHWDARGTRLARQHPLAAQSRFLSVRAVRRGKLYVLMGVAPAEQFQALVPEFEQALASLRID